MAAEPKHAAPDHAAPPDLWWLRWFLVACFLWTLWETQLVWQARGVESAIPNMPIGDWTWLDTLQFSILWLMIPALLAILIFPVGGLVAHTVLLLVGCMLDQTRLQPGNVSMTILLWGTLPWHGARLVARTHLVSLWFFAGLHKLLSPEYLEAGGPQLMQGTFPSCPAEYLQPLAVMAAVYELLLGVLAVIPFTRRAVPFLAAALHLGAVASLMQQHWNSAVWPWNIALAGAGFGLLWDDKPLWAECQQCSWSWSAAALFVLISPALFYASSFDAYLCHCLYSSNIPTAHVYFADLAPDKPPDGTPWRAWGDRRVQQITFISFADINVPTPPEHRIYVQWFRRRGKPGDTMTIRDSRWWAERNGHAERFFRCEAEGKIVEVPPAPP